MSRLRIPDSHLLWLNFPDHSTSATHLHRSPTTPIAVAIGLGSSAFARHYSQNLLFSSPYLDVSVQAVPFPFTG